MPQKKNLGVEVTIRVLGKDLTKDEAETLYRELQKALGKNDTPWFPNYHRYSLPTPQPITPTPWPNTVLYGATSPSDSGSGFTPRPMVEVFSSDETI